MNRWSAQLVLATLLLASCTTLDGYMPWIKTSSISGSQAAAKVAEATVTKARETDPEYQADPWSFVLLVRNKSGRPLSIQYKVVFKGSHGEPTDVQYGQVDFPAVWSEYRKGLVPEALSSTAQVYLYLPDESGSNPSPPVAIASPTPGPWLTPVSSPVPTPAPTPVP